MQTEVIKYCGAAVCALAAIIMLRSIKSEFTGFVSLGAAALMLTAAGGILMPAVSDVIVSLSDTDFGGYASVLMKALGVTLAVQFTSEVCRDAGEGALASKLELIGKAELLILCIPLIGELTSLASEIMNA